MNTIIFRSIIGTLVLAGCVRAPARADSPGDASLKGKVLLLETERILEGDIERQEYRYCIRRELGESWVQVDKVIRLCATRAEAFECLHQRANLSDVDELLRLARWCQCYDLPKQGVAQARAALDLCPDHPEARRLLHWFERAAATPPAPVLPVRPAPADSAPPANLSLEVATCFSLRVQPILMNACIGCHSGGRGGSFQLINTFEEGSRNRRATQHNLVAALAQVNRSNGPASPLVVKAATIHGGMAQPPLKGRQLPAHRLLEEWVQLVLAETPEVPAAPGATATPSAPASSAEIQSTGIFVESHSQKHEPTPWAVDAQAPSVPGPASAPAPAQAQAAPPPSTAAAEAPMPTPPAPVNPPAPQQLGMASTVAPFSPTGIFGSPEVRPTPPAAAPASPPAGIFGSPEVRPTPRFSSPTPPPAAPVEPVDPFDPLIFNRAMHPELSLPPTSSP